jgi:sialate O-acetylesterase
MLELGAPFGNHMVVQRDRRNVLWGWDRAGQDIAVRVDGAREPIRLRAIAGQDAAFRVELPPLRAGAAYQITVSGSSEQVLRDVVAGEVWLASGQSNMEWSVAQSAGAREAILGASDVGVRWLRVARVASRTPARTVDATWRVVTPSNVGGMTAVGHAFACALRERLDVPVGIIDASWGGTPIEAWTSLEGLRSTMPDLDDRLASLARDEPDIDRIRAGYARLVSAWEADMLPDDPGNRGEALGWAMPSFDDAGWDEMPVPGFWQDHGMKFNGVVWFRRRFVAPADWVGRDLWLELGAIDDFDCTYVNGEVVGEHPRGTPGAFQIPRRYRVPGRLVRPGENVIAVRVFDHAGQGGFAGPAEAMRIGPEGGTGCPLDGPWRHAIEHRIDLVPHTVWQSFPETPAVLSPQCAPASLFHAMIAPLVPFGLGGVLWYQGENDVAAHRHYRARQVAFIRDLRTRFGQGQIPFYLVQLAGFLATPEWAYLREAQAEARSEPWTGMATAIDLGDPHDIHPKDKRSVGRRLAALALRERFGCDDVEAYGPRLSRVEIDGPEVRVHFAHAAQLRTVGDAKVSGFELAGADLVFFPAEGAIQGESVVVRSQAVSSPVAVRYAFADCPDVNLVNAAGLPAEPFRTDAAPPTGAPGLNW